ncbi:MAG: sulfur carrier protein ThiS [Proteobacteria bacterium]|nr:sulfur carrier protein ThiS [Pseudomonadota bacterium]
MKKKNKIKIIVNGRQITVNSKYSLKNLVDKLKIPLNKIAIEHNKEIIDKKKLNKINLSNNDKVEIVHFIGGIFQIMIRLK